MTWSDERGHLLDHTIPAQNIVVAERRPDRELLGVSCYFNRGGGAE